MNGGYNPVCPKYFSEALKYRIRLSLDGYDGDNIICIVSIDVIDSWENVYI